MKKYQEGGLTTAADSLDPATGYLGILASQYQTSPEAQKRAREILDQLMAEDAFADEEEILAQFEQTADQAREALRQARERILADEYNNAQIWLAAAQGFGAPTRTGAFGETLGNVAGAIREPLSERDQFRRDRDTQIMGLDTALAGVDENLLTNQFKLAQLRREMMGDLGQEALKTLGKSTSSRPYVSPGSRARDTAMAQTLNDWQTQGQADAVKSLAELSDAIKNLGESDKISGPWIGMIPKIGRDVLFPKSADTQELIEQTAQRSLRAILGAQFAQKEGEMLLQRTFNPRLDESVNRERAFRLYKMLEFAAQEKNRASEHFQTYGTMEGFDGKVNWTIEDFEPPPVTHQVRLEDGTIVTVPKDWGEKQVEEWYAQPEETRQKFSRGGRIRYQGGGAVDIGDLEGSEPTEESSALFNLLMLLTGGTAGAAGGLGLESLSNRLNELKSDIPRVGRGERLVADALDVEGIDPRAMTDEVKRARRMGVPEMPLDVSGRLGRELGERAMMAGGQDAERAIQELEARHEGSQQRVGRQVEKGLRASEFFSEEQKLTDRLYSRAREAYRKAYSENPSIKMPSFFGELVDNKYGQQAMEYALEFMELEGKKMGKEDAIGMVRRPTLEFLDMLKRGFDQIIRKEESMGPTPLGHALRAKRKQLVSFLDNPENVTPAYQEARRQYKGDLEVLEALELGRKDFHRLASEELRTMIQDMSFAEKDALRTGVAQRLYEAIYGPSTDVKAARRLMGSEEMKRRLQLLFDKPREWRIFEAALQREMDLFESEGRTINRAERGRTSRMTQDLLEMEDPLNVVKEKIGRGPLMWALRFLPTFRRSRPKIELSEKEADEIIRILTTGDLKELDKLGERLTHVQERSRTRRGRRGKAAMVGSAVGAALAALGIGYDEEEVVDISELD